MDTGRACTLTSTWNSPSPAIPVNLQPYSQTMSSLSWMALLDRRRLIKPRRSMTLWM